MSSKICRKFQYLSAWVMDVLSEAMERKLPCSEETVTEAILLKLSRYTGNNFGVKSFTKNEESINGADWEIWFCNGTHGISIRLQAKRLYRSGKYEALKRGNSNQRKNLKEKAKEVGATPLYFFIITISFLLHCYGHAFKIRPHIIKAIGAVPLLLHAR